jgi:hypothetical protein
MHSPKFPLKAKDLKDVINVSRLKLTWKHISAPMVARASPSQETIAWSIAACRAKQATRWMSHWNALNRTVE